MKQRCLWIEVRSDRRPGTRENTRRERNSPRQEREEQMMVSSVRAEVREEDSGSTPLMSISTAKLVR